MSMAEKLWDLANLIAGFGVLQAIATIFALTKGELKGLRGLAAHRYAAIGTVVFTLFYVIAIIWCGLLGAGFGQAGQFDGVACDDTWPCLWCSSFYGSCGHCSLGSLA